MASNTANARIQWQPSPVVQALQDAIQYPRTSPSWFDILYPRKEEQPRPNPQPEQQQPPQQADTPPGKN